MNRKVRSRINQCTDLQPTNQNFELILFEKRSAYFSRGALIRTITYSYEKFGPYGAKKMLHNFYFLHYHPFVRTEHLKKIHSKLYISINQSFVPYGRDFLEKYVGVHNNI